MIGIYFSGTGNSKYCIEKFLKEYDEKIKVFSIEDKEVINQISQHSEIVFSYPVQYSNIPKILRDFIIKHQNYWKDKKVFIIATMALFSGDGAGVLACLLKKYGAVIVGGLHLKMPDSICDEKVLKRSWKRNRKLVINAEYKIEKSVKRLQNKNPSQEGLNILYRFCGLFGQRLYFINKTKTYSDKLKINENKCIGCGKCITLCPMRNISLKNETAISYGQCTMCYRCINHCPKQAITLLGKHVIEQGNIKKYL